MPAMQLSLDLDRQEVDACESRTRRVVRSSLAAGVAARHAAHDADSHACAVDAFLTAASPRIATIARLCGPSWPSAHVEVENLVQEVMLEVAAALHRAPCQSEAQTQAWMSTLTLRVLYDLRHAAARDAREHSGALEQFAAENASVACMSRPYDGDDEPDEEPSHLEAA